MRCRCCWLPMLFAMLSRPCPKKLTAEPLKLALLLPAKVAVLPVAVMCAMLSRVSVSKSVQMAVPPNLRVTAGRPLGASSVFAAKVLLTIVYFEAEGQPRR